MPGKTTCTMARVDAKSAPLRTIGHEKASALHCCPNYFVVLRGVYPIPELTWVSGVVVVHSQNGWVNSKELTKDWVMCLGPAQFSQAEYSCRMYRNTALWTR